MSASQITALCVAAVLAIVLSATTDDVQADQDLAIGQQSRWEYKVEHCDYSSGLEAKLNQMGNESWELVQISDGIGIFKRPKAAPDQTTRSGVRIELAETSTQ